MSALSKWLSEVVATTGDSVPGDVDTLASPSDKLSLQDQRELESSQNELLASLSAVSDVMDSVGLIGSSGCDASTCNGSVIMTLHVGSGAPIRAGAGSVRLTLASSTTSVPAAMKGSRISDSIIST